MTVPWDELWEEINWDRVTTIPFITERIHAIKAEGDRLQSAITQINECIGGYESKEWCGHCVVDGKCAQITLAVLEIREKLEAVREFVLSRRSDIEQDMENFGMLAPVLEYFLKVCVRD